MFKIKFTCLNQIRCFFKNVKNVTGFFQNCHRKSGSRHRIFSKMTQDFFKNDTEKAGVDTGKRESTQDFFKNDTGKRESTQDFFKNDTGKEMLRGCLSGISKAGR